MSVTVRDCMSLPSLSMAKVIAGEKGLDGIVNSVTVLEFDFTSDEIFTPNELAITAFYSIKDSVRTQVEAIHAFKRSGIVALVLFYSDMVLNGLDPAVADAAERCNLPLILLPEKDMGLKYSDVIHDISEAIFLNARSEDFYIDNTLNRISQMDASRRNIDTVLNLISEHNRSTAVLCDGQNRILGYSFWPAGNVINIEQLLSDESGAESCPSYTFKAQNSLTLKLFFVNPYSQLSRNILYETAQIIQLYLSIWNVNLNTNSRESILSLLLEDKYSSAAEAARVNDIDFSDFRSAVFFRSEMSPEELRSLASEADSRSICDIYHKDSILLLSLDLEGAKGQLLIEDITKIAVGKVYLLSKPAIVSELRRCYLSYSRHYPMIDKIFPSKEIIKYETLRFAELCDKIVHLNPDADEKKYYRQLLRPIADFGDEELLRTLQVYLFDADFSVKKTAELLFVHRNTVTYRLEHIKRLLGNDFELMPLLYDVYIGAALERFV